MSSKQKSSSRKGKERGYAGSDPNSSRSQAYTATSQYEATYGAAYASQGDYYTFDPYTQGLSSDIAQMTLDDSTHSNATYEQPSKYSYDESQGPNYGWHPAYTAQNPETQSYTANASVPRRTGTSDDYNAQTGSYNKGKGVATVQDRDNLTFDDPIDPYNDPFPGTVAYNDPVPQVETQSEYCQETRKAPSTSKSTSKRSHEASRSKQKEVHKADGRKLLHPSEGGDYASQDNFVDQQPSPYGEIPGDPAPYHYALDNVQAYPYGQAPQSYSSLASEAQVPESSRDAPTQQESGPYTNYLLEIWLEPYNKGKWQKATGLRDTGNFLGPLISLTKLILLGYRDSDINFRKVKHVRSFGSRWNTMGAITLGYQSDADGRIKTEFQVFGEEADFEEWDVVLGGGGVQPTDVKEARVMAAVEGKDPVTKEEAEEQKRRCREQQKRVLERQKKKESREAREEKKDRGSGSSKHKHHK